MEKEKVELDPLHFVNKKRFKKAAKEGVNLYATYDLKDFLDDNPAEKTKYAKKPELRWNHDCTIIHYQVGGGRYFVRGGRWRSCVLGGIRRSSRRHRRFFLNNDFLPAII